MPNGLKQKAGTSFKDGLGASLPNAIYKIIKVEEYNLNLKVELGVYADESYLEANKPFKRIVVGGLNEHITPAMMAEEGKTLRKLIYEHLKTMTKEQNDCVNFEDLEDRI